MLHKINHNGNWSSETEIEEREGLACHFRWSVDGSMCSCIWTAEVHFSSDIPQYEGPDYSKVIPSLPKQVVSPLKSHSLCYSIWSQLSVSESFLSALQDKQLSLSCPLLSPPPLLPFCLSLSPCHSCSFAGWWEASEGMSRRPLRQVCERHSGLSVERDVSPRACLWSYPQPGDNRWCRREGNPGNHPGAGWQRWAVTVEREYTERGGVTRPTELALPPMSHHLHWVFDCLLPLPSLCPSLPPQSFSRCRASSNRSALTGPSCVCTLTDCSFWLCVCVSKERRGR